MRRIAGSLRRALLPFGFIVLASAAGLAGCGSNSRERTNAAAALEPCRLDGIAREVRCGSIDVAENPDRPDGRAITIRYAVVPATAARTLDDAIFVIAGGPGQSAMSAAGMVMPLFEELNARRDIVFIDQRGTGKSNPLTCLAPGERVPFAASFDAERALARLHACRDRLTAKGNDLAQYATWIAVRDFERVRAQLGYASIDLWGVSYGTRAALEYTRQFPDRVRVAVLDGVAPATMTLPASFAVDTDAALDAWAAACARDRSCNARTPDLRASVDALLERAASGIEARVADPYFDRAEQLRITRDALLSLLRAPLYAPASAALLPYALEHATASDYAPLIAIGALIGGSIEDGFAEAMHYSVVCAEDMPRIDAAVRASVNGTRAGGAFIDQYARACVDWPTRPVPPAFYAAPAFDAPVLMFSGGLDPATPPRHAEGLRAGLAQALHLVAPHLGHGVSSQACGPEIVRRFVRDASLDDIDGACLATLPMPLFFAPPRPTPDANTQ